MKIYEVRAAIEHERFEHSDKCNYIEGWCFIIPKYIYEQFGLFDETFEFATCEDSDFSFRLLNAGLKIEAYHIPVHHLNSKTRSLAAVDWGRIENKNLNILWNRWKDATFAK